MENNQIKQTIFFLFCSLLILVISPSSVLATDTPIVGAIRWDAWVGKKSIVGTTVEKQLGPQKWQYRVPFFGKIILDNKVEIEGYTQAIIDQEIAYAKRAGLDYWAFDLYPPTDPMTQALNLYLTSEHVGDINFSFIVGPMIFQNDPQRLISLMQKPTYQKVLGDRPLVYIMDLNNAWINSWGQGKGGGMIGAKKRLDEFRLNAQQAGLGNPYIVLINFWNSVQQEKDYTQGLASDAISRYLVGGRVENASFASLAGEAERLWNVDKSSGVAVVPLITTGLDARPKVEIPNPWAAPPPISDVKYFYAQPTPEELSQHFRSAITWMQNNISSTPANTVLVYAWNENVEGGWLTPTLSEGTARIDALSPVLGGIIPQPTTAVTLPGDLNLDGKVNIFDYNILVSNFGSKYTIFDYNNLVSNFGK